ncbi:hypothetical protein NY151_07690 [Porphyromonas gingivalis]|uniref:HU domain-containing protein n=1 Tax=Porphyromonas gingivalis TaxID=837 RepID=A0AAE9XCN8_PORGN|nr:HU family DNA-binding protein [Porphyromonas gingivalis]WCG04244.1 hypothetical protein NY151_07690 [Porphyromonas gingivalis]
MIKIKAIERKAGFGKTSKTLWYPAIHLHSDVKFEEFIELVSDETTVSSADIKAVFDRAAKVLIRLLQTARASIVATWVPTAPALRRRPVRALIVPTR